MISFRQEGGLDVLIKKIENLSKSTSNIDLDKYAQRGLSALKSATPKNTGLTSQSWSYTITQDDNGYSIQFSNSNIQNGIPIAIILQYGHATRNGGWVEGIDYINPAIQRVFEEIANQAWKEVSKS